MKKPLLCIAAAFAFGVTLHAQETNQQQVEEVFKASIDATRFKTHLQRLTERPHVAGSATNEAVQAYMASVMESAGLEVASYPYDVYLPSTP
ncbi:MAG: hypothetical protein ACO3L1_01060, partial [Flavobacteriaceae bacterium]